MTFVLLKLVGLVIPLRLSQQELEEGDHAIHGNEVYPSDVPTLGGPHAPGWQPTPAQPALGGGGDGARRRDQLAPGKHGTSWSPRGPALGRAPRVGGRPRGVVAAPRSAGAASSVGRRHEVGDGPLSRRSGWRRPRRTCSIGAAAGERRTPAGVATTTWRTGPRGDSARIAMSSRTLPESQLGDQRHADAGGHQALHGLVVVALEGDLGLEADGVACAHDLAGARAVGRRLDPRLVEQVGRPSSRLPASGWSPGSATYIGSSSSSHAVETGPERLADVAELEHQREVELAGAEPRQDLLRLALGQRQLDRPGAGRGRSRWRAASAPRRRVGKEAIRSWPPRSPTIAASSDSAASQAGEDALACARRAPGRRGSGAGRAAAARSASRPTRSRAWRSAARPPTGCRTGRRPPPRTSRCAATSTQDAQTVDVQH